MKRKILVTGVITFLMMATMLMSTFAAIDKNITIPSNQAWTSGSSEARTGNYSNVKVKCNSVYPESGTDNFSKIQTRITNSSGTLIMNTEYTTLTEGNDYSYIAIKQGYLNTTTVRFQFRGNTSKSAKAVVSFSAR